MSSNLTGAGWLLLIVSIVLLGGGWYLAEFVFEIHVDSKILFVGGGLALIGGGGWILNRCGVEIMK